MYHPRPMPSPAASTIDLSQDWFAPEASNSPPSTTPRPQSDSMSARGSGRLSATAAHHVSISVTSQLVLSSHSSSREALPGWIHQSDFDQDDDGQTMKLLDPQRDITDNARGYDYEPHTPSASFYQHPIRQASISGHSDEDLRYNPATRRRSASTSSSISSASALPEKFDVSAWSFSREVEHGPEPDDWLHNATESSALGSGSIFTWRGLMNIGFLCVIATALLFLFAGYPILANFAKIEQSAHGAFNLGGVNGTGQVPSTFGNFGLIDQDTPENKYNVIAATGEEWDLVFSDEFNEPGRTFYPGDDPYWEAVDLHAWGTNDLEWYDPRQVTTKSGNLRIQLTKERTHDLDYIGGSLQSWNKFCFSGGRLEASIRLPAKASVYGLWPAFWTMGNLGRVGYGGTLEGLWPYSYDSCDAGTLPNQTRPDGTPSIARTSGTDKASDYALSYLPGQRLSRCTCFDDKTHPGPRHADGSWVGRSAPEIDVIEAQTNAQTRIGEVSLSSQWAPFNPGYDWLNLTHMIIEDNSVTHLNSYKGGVSQETTSGVANTNQDCYEYAQNGTQGCFAVYAIEYRTGPDGYIKWFNDNKLAWTYLEGGMGPVPIADIGNRHVPDEPMYLLLNLAISHNFGPIDLDGLESLWPVTMEVDYIRVYQDPKRKNIGCDNDDRPTSAYIKRYEHAYNDPNITTWEQMTNGAAKPINRLSGKCPKN